MVSLPASPLPLAEEVDRRSRGGRPRRRGGVGVTSGESKAPSPTLPRKREREFSSGRLGSQLLALFDRLFDGADHVEGLLGQVVVLGFAQSAESLDGVC